MSIIQTTPSPTILAQFSGHTAIVASSGGSLSGFANINGSTSITAQTSSSFSGSATINSKTEIIAFGHILGEANIFPEIDCKFGPTLEPTAQKTIIPFVNCSFGVKVNSDLTKKFQETFPFEIIVDIVPPQNTRTMREWDFELKINGTTNIQIKSFTYSEGRGDVGNTLSVELADINDYPAIVAANSFRFRIAEVIGGVLTWKTYIDNGILDTSSYSISRQANAPLTQVQFSNKSSVQERLGKRPRRNLVLYDQRAVSIQPDEFEILRDVNGTEYITELIPYNGMTLHDVFQKIFVNRCGFTDYETNLPDFAIKRVNFEMTDSYLSSVAGLIGMFEPLIFEYNNKVWIIDTTSVLPDGFPVSTTLQIGRSTSIRLSSNDNKIDAYLLSYSEDGLDYDYITTRTETKFRESSTDSFSEAYTKIEVTKIIQEYRQLIRPSVIIDSKTLRERRETTDRHGTLLGRVIEEFTYDRLGRRVFYKTENAALIPNAETGTYTFEDISEVRKTFQYIADPFQPSRQILGSVWSEHRALIASNPTDRFYDAPFEEPYMRALESGNLKPGITTRFGLIKSTNKTISPIAPGKVDVQFIVRDFIRNTIPVDDSDSETGDYSSNGVSSQQRKIIVPFEPTSLDGDNLNIVRLNVGDLPATYAISLAERKMKRINDGSTQVSVDIVGTDFYWRRGLPAMVEDIEGQELVNILIEGFSVTGANQSLTSNIEGQKLS